MVEQQKKDGQEFDLDEILKEFGSVTEETEPAAEDLGEPDGVLQELLADIPEQETDPEESAPAVAQDTVRLDEFPQ